MKEKALILLVERKFSELRKLLTEMIPADIAVLMEDFPKEILPLLFRVLPKELAAETFVEMNGDMQELLISAFSDLEIKEVVDQLFIDDMIDIIEEMPANVVKRIIQNCNSDKRRLVNEVLNYPKDSAGSIMTIEFIDLKSEMTVQDAFKRIKRTGLNKETIYTCYVIDDNRKLLGLVTAKTLMLSELDDSVSDIMETNIIYAGTHEGKEDVANKIKKYDLLALPVVDNELRLVGIVTVDDAIDVIQEVTEEDFAKMAAINPIKDSYFKTTVFQHAKNRIVWLLILMLSATVTGAIITKYEQAFAAVPILVAFIPMLMDTGGNCGAQSSTMVIRGMAVDEIHLKDFFKVWFKEIRVGALIGVTLAVVNAIRVVIMYRSFEQYRMLSLVTGLTIIAAALLAKSLGCILPMLAKKIKMDPAIMASPLLTTICDTCVVLIYFNIAMKVLRI